MQSVVHTSMSMSLMSVTSPSSTIFRQLYLLALRRNSWNWSNWEVQDKPVILHSDIKQKIRVTSQSLKLGGLQKLGHWLGIVVWVSETTVVTKYYNLIYKSSQALTVSTKTKKYLVCTFWSLNICFFPNKTIFETYKCLLKQHTTHRIDKQNWLTMMLCLRQKV